MIQPEMSLHFARLPSTRAFGVMTVRWCDHNLVGYLFIVHIRDIQLEISSIYVIYLLKSLTFVNDYIIDYIIVYIIYIYAATHIKWCNDNILSLPLLSSPQYGMHYPDPAWRESSVDGKVGHHHAKRLWGPDSSSLRSIQPASVFSGLWIHFKYFQLMRGKQSWK